MLIEFALQNFKSFKELQVLSLEASKESTVDDGAERIFETDGYRILKTKAIYGANASGKSNLIMGMVAFWQIIQNNFQNPQVFHTLIPYRLDGKLDAEPTYFQIIFLHEGTRYRYGFEATQDKVHSEWLFKKKSKEVSLFAREGNEVTEINNSQFKEGKEFKRLDILSDKVLAISALSRFKFANVSKTVVNCILNKIAISPQPIKEVYNFWHLETQKSIGASTEFRNWLLRLLKEIDPTISHLRLVKDNSDPENNRTFTIIEREVNTSLKVKFLLEAEEASGTQKIFDYAHILYGCLTHGLTLILDEMDALLHPKLTRKIIELFQSPEAHPQAQLLFATHDTNLMDHELLRRDQITFVEKSKEGWSEIFDLSDIKGVRAKDLFEKNYLKGNYGALPTLNRMESVLLDKEIMDVQEAME